MDNKQHSLSSFTKEQHKQYIQYICQVVVNILQPAGYLQSDPQGGGVLACIVNAGVPQASRSEFLPYFRSENMNFLSPFLDI